MVFPVGTALKEAHKNNSERMNRFFMGLDIYRQDKRWKAIKQGSGEEEGGTGTGTGTGRVRREKQDLCGGKRQLMREFAGFRQIKVELMQVSAPTEEGRQNFAA